MPMRAVRPNINYIFNVQYKLEYSVLAFKCSPQSLLFYPIRKPAGVFLSLEADLLVRFPDRLSLVVFLSRNLSNRRQNFLIIIDFIKFI